MILWSQRTRLFEQVMQYGLEYLKKVGQEGQPLTTKECRFCHVEEASEDIEKAINEYGYYIYEMEGCTAEES